MNEEQPLTPYISPDGYKPPGCWVLPYVSEAALQLKEALHQAFNEIPDDARFHYEIGQKKAEQDRTKLWPDFDDPRVQRFEQVRVVWLEAEILFRNLRDEGKPPNLKLARHRTTLEQQEADLEG